VNTIAIQSDGKILAGGAFTTYQGVGANRIILLNSDGSRDNSFSVGTGFASTVNTIAIQSDGKILAGGAFSRYQGVSANRIIRLNSDGSRDNSFSVGGGFIGNVSTIAIQGNGKILAGGSFFEYYGVPDQQIFQLNNNGTLNPSYITSPIDNYTASFLLKQNDNKLLAFGPISSYNSITTYGLIRLNLDGSLDTSMIGGFDTSSVTILCAVMQSNGRILAGGSFTTYQNISSNNIAAINSDGSRDNSFIVGTGFNNVVSSIAIQSDGKILVGGAFTTYQGVGANRIIRLNSDGTIDSSFNIGSTWGFDSIVNDIKIQDDGKILVGGSFTTYNQNGTLTSAIRLIRLNSDGTVDSSFGVGSVFDTVGSTVHSIAIQNDNKILVSGNFTTGLLRLNSDGSLDSSFIVGDGFNDPYYKINIIIQNDGKILVGGAFTTCDNIPTNSIVRLNSDGSIDYTFYMNLNSYGYPTYIY
jgi:uncharacterized delta-60 repeat protein